MQVLARFGLADVVHADLLQDLPGDVQTEAGLGAVQLVVILLARGRPCGSFFVPALPQPDLLEDAHEQLVHVVLDPARGLYEFAVAGDRQRFAVWRADCGGEEEGRGSEIRSGSKTKKGNA